MCHHGGSDEIRGQVVKATIILGDKYRPRAGEELIRELQDHVKQITAPYKYPRIIEFVDELPKTISGKIRRKAIRADRREPIARCRPGGSYPPCSGYRPVRGIFAGRDDTRRRRVMRPDD